MVKRFDRTRYAEYLTEMLEAVLDYNRQTAPLARSGAAKRVDKARNKIIAAEDDLKAKANRLERNLLPFDALPEEERPPGYSVGQANWIALLDTYEALWAGRKCIELLRPTVEGAEAAD